MRRVRALRYQGYVSAQSTGHATRSTSGAMHFVVDADGPRDVVLKAVNGNGGAKQCVNELVCGELAFRVDLPCREPLLVEVPPDFPPVPLRCADGFLAPGLSFGVPFIQGEAPPTARHVAGAVNHADLAGIFAFDSWVANLDRTTPGNLVAAPSAEPDRYVIWMIDHGHALTGTGWTAPSLLAAIERPAHPCLDILRSALADNASLDRWVSTICRVTDATIQNVVDDVPREWLPSPEERAALICFLRRRRAGLRRIVRNYVEEVQEFAAAEPGRT